MPTKAQFPSEQSEEGEFERQEDAFRDFVSTDGSTPYPSVAEDDICRMFNDVFNDFGNPSVDVFPKGFGDRAYRDLLLRLQSREQRVCKAGFATKQRAYEKASRALFAALDELEARLSARRYLLGNRIVEADWRLFCTLVRFDAVYHGHFK